MKMQPTPPRVHVEVLVVIEGGPVYNTGACEFLVEGAKVEMSWLQWNGDAAPHWEVHLVRVFGAKINQNGLPGKRGAEEVFYTPLRPRVDHPDWVRPIAEAALPQGEFPSLLAEVTFDLEGASTP